MSDRIYRLEAAPQWFQPLPVDVNTYSFVKSITPVFSSSAKINKDEGDGKAQVENDPSQNTTLSTTTTTPRTLGDSSNLLPAVNDTGDGAVGHIGDHGDCCWRC